VGNPRVPEQLKVVRGTSRKERQVPDVPRSPDNAELPDPPEWLDAYGAEKWRELVPGLGERQLLTGAALSLLEVLCEAYGSWRRAAAVTRGGVSYRKRVGKRSGGGYLNRARPESAVEISSRKEYMGLLGRYTTLLELPPKGSAASDFDNLLDDRSGRRRGTG
jgi:terminase small subunit-like protein